MSADTHVLPTSAHSPYSRALELAHAVRLFASHTRARAGGGPRIWNLFGKEGRRSHTAPYACISRTTTRCMHACAFA
eukprot:3996011-Pleurochrysis_carterae.AAC.1